MCLIFKIMRIRYAIIENEEYSRINLQNIIKAVRPEYELIFYSETVCDSVSMLSKSCVPDLVFMDIELDDGNCFDIFSRADPEMPVIFTTAYDEYALKAFRVNSVDYILKPITEEDVERAILKYEKRNLAARDWRQVSEDYTSLRTRSRMLVSDGNGYSFVHTDDIAWFESEDKYVSIRLNNGKILLTDQDSLDMTAQVLDSDRFFRISRQVVTSISAISKVSKHLRGRLQVELRAGSEKRMETVSAARRPGFLNWLGHI